MTRCGERSKIALEQRSKRSRALESSRELSRAVETGETPFPPMGVELTTSRLEAEKKSRYATRPQL